jgi:taurine dioxygenase
MKFDALRGILFRHGTLVILDQVLTPDAHSVLAEQFGKIDIDRYFTPLKTHPMIAQVRTNSLAVISL